jgi:1-acyl-sn-glycerol-3-phosphate acyltransferase
MVVSIYFALAPFGYLGFMLLALVPPAKPERRARFLQSIMRGAFTLMHGVLRTLRLMDCDPRRIAGPPLPDGPAVLVANHPTLCDITATMAGIDDLTTAIKPGLYRSWAFRPLLAGALHFEGAGAHAISSAQVVDAAVDRLKRGFRVIIFPEGTRSPEHGLGPFGRTAFEVACRANVPIVPIVLRCEPPWLTKDHGPLDPPKAVPTLTLQTLDAVHPSDYGSSSRRLRDVIYARFREQLGLPEEGKS